MKSQLKVAVDVRGFEEFQALLSLYEKCIDYLPEEIRNEVFDTFSTLIEKYNGAYISK